MTRLELLQLLVGQARVNGFEFRKWYVTRLGLPWTTYPEALEALTHHRRYYILLFSHDFASHFWKAGEQITFQVPPRPSSAAKPTAPSAPSPAKATPAAAPAKTSGSTTSAN
jgi:hypothetical protein